MAVYRAQAHLDAPLKDVWALIGNPATYPEWWPPAVEIRGQTFEVGDVFTQVLEMAGRRLEYTRTIDRRDEFKELRWHCPTTGGFQHWLLTDAEGGTFVDIEMGIDPPAHTRYELFDKTVGRWFTKRWAEQAIDGLRRTLSSARTPSAPRRAHAPADKAPPPAS
jgi:polyketide cyclase/dehydrase/lipid transport protein